MSFDPHNPVFAHQLNKARGLGDMSKGSWALFVILAVPAFWLGCQAHALVGIILVVGSFMAVHLAKNLDHGRYDFVELWFRKRFRRPVFNQVERDERYERFAPR